MRISNKSKDEFSKNTYVVNKKDDLLQVLEHKLSDETLLSVEDSAKLAFQRLSANYKVEFNNKYTK